jgi:hypothetical protein
MAAQRSALTRMVRCVCALACALVSLLPARAHVTGTGLATVDWEGDRAIVRLTLAPTEIGEAAKPVTAAAHGDAAAARQVGDWLQQHLRLSVNDEACRPARTRLQAAAGDDRVVLQLELQCADAPGRLQMHDTLGAVFGEHYRTIASFARPDGSRTEHVFDLEHTQSTLDFGRTPPSGSVGFLRLGAAHILGGWDHLLFLAALLIGQRSVRSLLITVTAFTVAHSVSLAAATFGWVHGSSLWVEPVIALSVMWMALENLLGQDVRWRRHALTFAFGLVHGLAFAEALVELNLAGWPLARALLGFNLGVEAAQVAVVLLLAPLLAWLARRAPGALIERGLSIAIAVVGAVWLVQRLIAAP